MAGMNNIIEGNNFSRKKTSVGEMGKWIDKLRVSLKRMHSKGRMNRPQI